MEVILSPLAEKKLELLLDYLQTDWSESSQNNFLKKLRKEFELISLHPYRCKKTDTFPFLYKCIVTKQTSAIYKVNEDKSIIEIVTIFDNRQDPNKIKSELESIFR